MARKQSRYDNRREVMKVMWDDFQRKSATHPYVMMQAVGDEHDSHLCQKLDGVIMHKDNAWLVSYWPPHEPNCRCTVRSLSYSQMDREGLSVTPDQDML